MNCKEFEQLIPDYIEKKLDYFKLKSFNEHMEQCPDCKEELVIQFLVTEGIQRLEQGNAFDLQGELNQRFEEAKRKVKFYGRFSMAGEILEVVAMCIFTGIIIYMML
ncbi:MAG: anti-sigma factor family protein [Acetatifactor sp.]